MAGSAGPKKGGSHEKLMAATPIEWTELAGGIPFRTAKVRPQQPLIG